ncbi:hypothetical protein PISMIDRAFT_446638 [Pisolithus microcarpus 441]|uniref:Uncharacterized protein n=1 Tax=Pisolithus microcarpus 441 TaxID=765257 RepID=A0A0C9ZVB8_9AGAM|nr:hypothetical protein PISMIDRAFT_446638 [Pisolithus microcarpus 441]
MNSGWREMIVIYSLKHPWPSNALYDVLIFFALYSYHHGRWRAVRRTGCHQDRSGTIGYHLVPLVILLMARRPKGLTRNQICAASVLLEPHSRDTRRSSTLVFRYRCLKLRPGQERCRLKFSSPVIAALIPETRDSAHTRCRVFNSTRGVRQTL